MGVIVSYVDLSTERAAGRRILLNDLPKISIVMPSLNQVQYVEEAILSVVRQEYPRLEFLVIDGGLRASGDYIGWLNSDDKYEVGALMKVGQYLSKHPDVDLLYGQAAQINAGGEILKWHAEAYNKNRLFQHRDFIPTQACFFRRECLAYVGLLDTLLRWNGDWDLWRRIAKSYKVAYLDEHIGNWRIYHGTISYGKSVDYLAKELETIRSARRHSDRFLTPIELKIWPWVVIDFFRLRPFLRRVRDRMNRFAKPDLK
jgi:hypothetical protein